MMKAVIVDDEPMAREILMALLERYCPEIEVIGQAGDVEEGVKLARIEKPDLLFLDIQLREGTGFDLLKRLGNFPQKVIFITAFEEFAITAFRFSAVDYILKPINPDDLVTAVGKALNALESASLARRLEVMLDHLDPMSKMNRKLVLRTSTSMHIVGFSEIIRCQSEKNYTQFHLVSGETVVVGKTLKEYEELLSPFGFVRVHQSHLLNPEHIRRYEKHEGGVILMSDQSQVPVSFRKKEDFMRLIGQLQH
jgi:two-component system LytT family response regulator